MTPREDSNTAAKVTAIALILLGIAATYIAGDMPWVAQYPERWGIPFAAWISGVTDTIAEGLRPVSRAFAWVLEQPMLTIRDLLLWVPWPTLVALALAVAVASGAALSVQVLTVVSLLYVLMSGYWEPTMNTLALVAVAVPLSLMFGLLAGIATHRSRRVRAMVMPTLDLMQTMPTFAYLIPILFMFGFGPVVGLIASAIFATPPMVRNVVLGLERVPSEVVEAGHIAGTSRWQQLAWVELPTALAQIKVGVNQTIMAALSMVIIAAVIGGFGDIGWEVLSNMRKARFGDSLLSGAVIVLIAVVLDRVSAAFASNQPAEIAASNRRRARWISVAALFAIIPGLALSVPENVGWVREFSGAIDDALGAFVASSGDLLTHIKNLSFYYYLLPIRIGLQQAVLPFTWGFALTEEMKWGYLVVSCVLAALVTWRWHWQYGLAVAATCYVVFFGLVGAPWVVTATAIAAAGYLTGGWRVGLFALATVVFALTTGLWERTMLSIYLCGSAGAVAFFIGSTLGLCGASSDRFSGLLRPVLDTFQTIPLFVFLIPVLMLFQIGEFTALLAIVAYAFVPAARYTEAGLRQVSPELIEVARMQGCSPMQVLWQVKIPLAMPVILLGLNQTVMYSFSMLVIAALVGTTGLGQQIYIALSSADVGAGLTAGLTMALLAMVVDRMLRAIASRQSGKPA